MFYNSLSITCLCYYSRANLFLKGLLLNMITNSYKYRSVRIASLNRPEDDGGDTDQENEDPKLEEPTDEGEEVFVLDHPIEVEEAAPLSKEDRIRMLTEAYNKVKDSIIEDQAKCLVPLPETQIKIPKNLSCINMISEKVDSLGTKGLTEIIKGFKPLSSFSGDDILNIFSAIRKVSSGNFKINKDEFFSINKPNSNYAIYYVWMNITKQYSNDSECKELFTSFLKNITSVSNTVIMKYSADKTSETYFAGCISDKAREERKGFFSKLKWW